MEMRKLGNWETGTRTTLVRFPITQFPNFPSAVGGECGIRTHGGITTTVFKTVPLNHSGNSPYALMVSHRGRTVKRSQITPLARMWLLK
jgi:hypothetical protein